MWKPDTPIVIAGHTLTDQEAWWPEFIAEFHELCGGDVDHEWPIGLAGTLYIDRAPREAAEVAIMTLGYELPGFGLEEPFTPPQQRTPGLY